MKESPAHAASLHSPPPPTQRYNSRVGFVLFLIYLAFYGGFVLINAFNAALMETIVLAGLNFAIVYGFGLIIAALVMALLYGALCRNEKIDDSDKADQGEAK